MNLIDTLKNQTRDSYFTKRKCKLHDEKLTLFCPQRECIDNLNCFLCTMCFRTHNVHHLATVFPYDNIFSDEVLIEMMVQLKLYDENITKIKDNTALWRNLDDIYTHIESYVVKMIKKSKKKIKAELFGHISKKLPELRFNYQDKEKLEFLKNDILTQYIEESDPNILKHYLISVVSMKNETLRVQEEFKISEQKIADISDAILQSLILFQTDNEKYRKRCEDWIFKFEQDIMIPIIKSKTLNSSESIDILKKEIKIQDSQSSFNYYLKKEEDEEYAEDNCESKVLRETIKV